MSEQSEINTFIALKLQDFLWFICKKSFPMNANSKVSITKEDRYNVQDLVYEINSGPKSTNSLCTFYGIEGFALDAFSDFESLTEKAKNRLIEYLAISKPEADAGLTDNQIGKLEFFAEDSEGED